MSRARVEFTSSDAFLDNDERACEIAHVYIENYIEGTYAALRHNDGNEFARFVDGAWELPDGRRFSDWAMTI